MAEGSPKPSSPKAKPSGKPSGRTTPSKKATAQAAAAPGPGPGPDLARIVPMFGFFVAIWASLPRYSGPKLNVAQSTEVVDHVIPAIVVLVASIAGIIASRRAQGPGAIRFLGGMAVLLAGLWMMATHLPLVAEATRGDAPWPATIYHTSAALAVFGLGLLWATVTWAEAGEASKPTTQAK